MTHPLIKEAEDRLDEFRQKRERQEREREDAIRAAMEKPATDTPPPEELEGERTRTTLTIGSDVELAQVIIDELTDWYESEFVFSDFAFWYYDGRLWTELPEHELQQVIMAYDGEHYGERGRVRLTHQKLKSVTAIMALKTAQPDWFHQQRPGINCQSGFIEIDATGSAHLTPHNREHRCRYISDANWNGDPLPKKALLWGFLETIFQEDPERVEKEMLLQEIAGAALTGIGTRIAQPRAMILLGTKGNNGKSTWLQIMRAMLPPDAVSSISSTYWGEPRYRVKLAGRWLNTSDELSSAQVIESDLFKSIVTGEPIEAHDVYKPAQTIRPKAQHVFATNRLPSFMGGFDKGVRRRLGVVEFNRKIPVSEMIADIGERISAEDTDTAFASAIEGACRLIHRGYYAMPKSSERALDKWVRDTDAARAWISLRIIDGESPDVIEQEGYSRPEIYDAFRAWAERQGYRKDRLPQLPELVNRLEEEFPSVMTRRRNSSRRIRGITISQVDRDIDADDVTPTPPDLFGEMSSPPSRFDEIMREIAEQFGQG